MTRVHLDLLGPPDLRVDGASASIETRKALAVLALVVVDGVQRRDTLDVLLWPESDGKRARAALRRTLVALRKALPEGWLAEGEDVALAQPVATDLDAVVDLVGDGHGTRDPEQLEAADALHRGDFLAGLHFRDADPFEHWRRLTADGVARRHGRLLERLCRVHIEQGDLAAATEAAQRRLAMDPLHEPSHQQLMLLHAWRGDRASAARQYAECTRVLDEELGVAPLARTAALDRAVRTGTVEPPPREPQATAGHDREPVADRPSSQPPPSTPLVGRDDQLAALLEQWDASRDGGSTAVVVGEAGIGKTRLADELAARVRGPVVQLAARRGEGALAYAPVMAALRRVSPALEDLDPATRSEVARLVPDAVSIPPPEEGLASPAERTRFVDACASALLAALRDPDRPGLLVVEDLDQADRETRELVVHLTTQLREQTVLVLVTCRDVPGGLEGHLRLDLQRLTRDEVGALAASRDAAAITDRLHDESEGVPFLVVSYLDAQAAGDDGWTLPAAGRDLVRRRFDQLEEVPRQVLAAAAVLGGPQPVELLERVSGRSADEVVDAVEALTAVGVTTVADDGDVSLTHDKLRTVVLDEISAVRRRLLHGRAADALRGAAPPVAAATLAPHLTRAGREQEAATAHAAAGRHAAGLYANTDAIDHCERALAMGHEDQAGLLLLLGDLRVRAGDYTGAEQRYIRASAHAAGTTVVEQRLGALALRRGDDETAEERLRLALAAGPTDDLLVRTLAPLAQVLARRGDLDGAAELADRAVHAAAALSSTAAAVAHNVAGLVARRRGDLAGARTHLHASLAAAVRAEHRAAALNNLARVLGEDGATTEAIVLAEEALDAGRATGDRHREAALLSNLADLLHAAGRTEEAIGLQGAAAERFAGVGDAPTTSPAIWRLVDW